MLGCGQVCSLEATDACPGKIAEVLMYHVMLPGVMCASTKLWETLFYVFVLMCARKPFLKVCKLQQEASFTIFLFFYCCEPEQNWL